MSEVRASSQRKKRGLPSRVRMRHSQHFVEELVTRNEPTVGRVLPLAVIEPDPDQPRENMGKLAELVQSVRDKGVLEPILVRPDDSLGENKYRIISGERRYRAAMEAGLVEIPAIEMAVNATQALEIALIENLQRKDLTPFEEAEGFKALADAHGYTHEQIAEAVAKSRVAVTESLSLLKMPPKVRQAVQALDIQSKSLLLEVLKADGEDEMIRLLERIANEGLNRAALRREVKKQKGSGARAPKPYTFKFRAPDKRFSLSLSFRQSTVDPEDLVSALEEILQQLRDLEDEERAELLRGGA